MESVSLTKMADVDDDLLEITFGEPDPAIRKIMADQFGTRSKRLTRQEDSK